MILIVGLGNPGKNFEKTRHNIGFRVVDEFRSSSPFTSARVIDEFQEKNNFPDFKLAKKFLAEISEESLDDAKVILAKPQTFMNNSGRAVKLLTRNYKLKAKSLFIVHDDLDLPLGKIRISIGRSSAGHKGVESIIKELKTKDFVRFRIGIKSEKAENRKQKIEKFVLEKFSKDEEKNLGGVIKEAVEAIEMAIEKGVEKATSKYNQ